MAIPITATIQGHPWDLWGLAKLFDGTDTTRTLVTAIEPKGRPTFDATDKDAVTRFRIAGYDISATLISDELVWCDHTHRPDLRDMREAAVSLLGRVNGIAHLFDPDFRAVKLLYLSFQTTDSVGSMPFGDWTPNRSETYLGHDLQIAIAKDLLSMSTNNAAIKFVLDAIALPRTWASMYLIFDAIATNVGGQHKLKKKNWITEQELSDFTNAANNSRNLSEGIRHASKVPLQSKPLIPFEQAYYIVNKLAVGWLNSLRNITV
jgi:hypothetical protein